VTLLTDFGYSDPYVAAMKGVILSTAPQAEIVDITHDVPAHDVLSGAVVLAQSAPCFPPGTLHVVVVDPGVGSERRILAVRAGGQLLLSPDNGVITFLLEKLPLEAIASVRNTRYLPREASMTFHGRDVFAPLAGRILNGLDIDKLGPVPDAYKLLDLPAPQRTEDGIVGQVIYVDGFGNLVSNISERMVRGAFPDPQRLTVSCAGVHVGAILGTYSFAEPGSALALFNSMGYVEIAVNQGRACDALQAGVASQVTIEQS